MTENIPAPAPKKKPVSERAQGYIMVVFAIVLLWCGYQLGQPGVAKNRLLVAQTENTQSPFYQSVILVIEHTIGNGKGIILNKPLDGRGLTFHDGGPVSRSVTVTGIHTSDIKLPESVDIETTGLYYIDGDAASKLHAIDPPARWYIVAKGYVGWDWGQLDKEIENGAWKLIEYDSKLLLDTPEGGMWAAAQERPAIRTQPDDDTPKDPRVKTY